MQRTLHTTRYLWIMLVLCWSLPGLAQDIPAVKKEGKAKSNAVKDKAASDKNKTPTEESKSEKTPDPKDKPLTKEEEDALFDLNKSDALGPNVGRRRTTIERVREKELALMTRQELLDAGFLFGEQEKNARTRSTATLLALTAGAAAHGIGHWYMGDRKTGYILGGMEIASVLMFTIAGLVPLANGQDFGESAPSRYLMYTGTGLFGASYVLDIVGTIQSADNLSFKNSNRIKGVAASIQYGFLEMKDLPIRNVMRAGLELDAGFGYLLGQTTQDVGLQLSVYNATLGTRFWRSKRWPQTSVFLEVDGLWLQSRSLARFEQLGVAGMLGGALDLGLFSRTLNHVVLGLKTGYLHQWYALPEPTKYNPLGADPEPGDFGYGVGGLPFELFVHFNLSSRMHARFAYTRRDGALLNDTSDYMAVPSLQINYRSADKLDISFKAEYGAGVGIWGGFKYWLWQGESRVTQPAAESETESIQDTLE